METKLKGVPCKRLSTDSLLYAPAPALDEKKFHAWHARLTGGVVKVSRSKQRKQTERS